MAVPSTRRALAFAALTVALAAGGAAGPAAAATHTSVGAHYSFAYPDSWTASTNSTGDGAYLGPADGGFRPNVVAQHESEPTARNVSSWLLTYAQNSLNGVKQQLNVTEVQGPQTFTTAGGRLAADYIFERSVGNLTIRQRQVFFVSEFYRLTFFVTLSDKTSTYAAHAADWSMIVDSLAVSGEPGPAGAGLLTPLLIGAALAVAGAGAAVGLVLHSAAAKRKAALQAPGVPPAPMGSPPPPPPPR